jgi:hypothetical protein
MVQTKSLAVIFIDERSDAEPAAIAKIVFGIAKEWSLSDTELALFLGEAEANIAGWRKSGRIPIDERAEEERGQIVCFIDLWRSLSSFVSSTDGQTRWLKEPNEGFGGKSPMALVREDAKSLRDILDTVNWLRNPGRAPRN